MQPHDTQRLPAFADPADPHGEQPTERFSAASPEPARPGRGPGRRRGRTAALVAAGLVLLLVVGLVGVELGLRNSIGERLQREASEALGSTAQVDIGPRPMLLSIFDDTLGSVRITTDGQTPAGSGEPAPAIDITAQGVREAGDRTLVESLAGTVFASDQMMTAAAQQEASETLLGGLVQVQSVTSDPGAGTLQVDLGLAEATVTPRIAPGGRLQMDPEQASVLGFPLPDGLLGGTVSMMDSTLAELPDGVEITGARVVEGGLVLDVAGTDVVLEPSA